MSWRESWPDGVGRRWLDALTIPAAPWARPLLPEAGVPEPIAADPDGLRAVAERAARRREELQRSSREIDTLPGLDGGISREFVIHALHELAGAYGTGTAERLERWARLHVVEPHPVLWAWQLVFTRMLARPLPDVPAAIERVHGAIEQRLGADAAHALQAEIHRLAPPASEEERELGLDVSREAGILSEIVERERTLRCLREIRETAGAGELEEVLEFGIRVAQDLKLPPDVADARTLADALEGRLEEAPYESALQLAIPEGKGGDAPP